ncbi:fatty acyl-AMP ligase [Actinomadura hallensis]|uniref:fatty acyl-AMP ligase n=1 Tax=Actinomadura hallensis TaxID=337895 RepID=UPI001154F2A2|nr:fatty acyl-AMP ligase [Actinomadura hallensis]
MVVAELRRAGGHTAAALDAMREAIVTAVTTGHGVRPAAVHLGPPGTLSVITGGTVRRGAAWDLLRREC